MDVELRGRHVALLEDSLSRFTKRPTLTNARLLAQYSAVALCDVAGRFIQVGGDALSTSEAVLLDGADITVSTRGRKYAIYFDDYPVLGVIYGFLETRELESSESDSEFTVILPEEYVNDVLLLAERAFIQLED